MERGVRSVKCRARGVEWGVQSMKRSVGVWSVERGVRNVQCGVYSVECKVRSVKCRV